MLFLTTGANGAGKTLNTLELVRKKQVAEGRSVYYSGFDMDPAKAQEFGWQECDPIKWQDLPDGSIVVWDECQKGLPVRGSSAAVPPYIAALATDHRKRGFDFFFLTQHPLNIDKFVLRLIGSPGWHRHLRRTFGADMVSVCEWSEVNTSCEKKGASKSAKVSMVPFPKHVYGWYKSASLHTAKKSIPRQVYILGVLLIVIPLLIWYGIHSALAKGEKAAPKADAGGSSGAVVQPPQKPDYLASFVPRIPGLPNTAPRYDDLTKPTVAPRPAACMSMGARCSCYTQQGTALDTPRELCLQIVKRGYFQDWAEPQPGDKLQGGNPGQDGAFQKVEGKASDRPG